MAFLQIQLFSEVLNLATSVNVILPQTNQGIGIQASDQEALPKVLYLLHGYSDDHSTWMRRTSVERYASSHNLAVIMPAVNHSFYFNEMNGDKYWDYVSEELPVIMRNFLKISDRPEDTFVAGNSMGGYGAMRLALTYPERFAKAASLSGAVDVQAILDDHKEDSIVRRLFGSYRDIRGMDADLYHLMEKNAGAENKPKLYVSCGTRDFLYADHKEFVLALKSNNWDVISHDEPGAIHEWGFWDKEIKKFIDLIYE